MLIKCNFEILICLANLMIGYFIRLLLRDHRCRQTSKSVKNEISRVRYGFMSWHHKELSCLSLFSYAKMKLTIVTNS